MHGPELRETTTASYKKPIYLEQPYIHRNFSNSDPTHFYTNTIISYDIISPHITLDLGFRPHPERTNEISLHNIQSLNATNRTLPNFIHQLLTQILALTHLDHLLSLPVNQITAKSCHLSRCINLFLQSKMLLLHIVRILGLSSFRSVWDYSLMQIHSSYAASLVG